MLAVRVLFILSMFLCFQLGFLFLVAIVSSSSGLEFFDFGVSQFCSYLMPFWCSSFLLILGAEGVAKLLSIKKYCQFFMLLVWFAGGQPVAAYGGSCFYLLVCILK